MIMIYLQCDGCVHITTHAKNGRLTMHLLRHKAAKEGWQVSGAGDNKRRDSKDYCPQCVSMGKGKKK